MIRVRKFETCRRPKSREQAAVSTGSYAVAFWQFSALVRSIPSVQFVGQSHGQVAADEELDGRGQALSTPSKAPHSPSRVVREQGLGPGVPGVPVKEIKELTNVHQDAPQVDLRHHTSVHHLV